MNKIASALNYIDEDLIFNALETVSAYNANKASVYTLKTKAPKHIQVSVKVKAAAISFSALLVCAVIAIWAVIALLGNHALDIYRLDKQEKILGSFADIQQYYPDNEMAEKLTALQFNEMQIALYYDNDTDWQDKDNWYSLIFNGYGENFSSYDVLEKITLHCLFTGSLEYWKVDSVYNNNTQYITIGQTQIQLAYSEITECSYAIFEKNEIIYDLRIQFGNSTTTDLMTILKSLLN